MIWYILGAIAIWIFGFLVGRNNPSLAAVNSLIDSGKAVINTAGKIISAAKKAA